MDRTNIDYNPLIIYNRIEVQNTLLLLRRKAFIAFNTVLYFLLLLMLALSKFVFKIKIPKYEYIVLIIIIFIPSLSCIILRLTFNNILNIKSDIWFHNLSLDQIKSKIISTHTCFDNSVDSTKLNQDIENYTCIICNQSIHECLSTNEYSKFVKLECNHTYCLDCISEWCHRTNTCALCRKEIIQEYI